MRATLLWAVVSAIAVYSACGDDSGGVASNTGGGSSDSGSQDSPSAFTLRIEPLTTSADVVKGQALPSVQFRAFAKHASGGSEQDVSQEASWALSMLSLGSFTSPGTLALKEAGGTATITATWSGATASSTLTVKLSGDVFGPGTDPSTKAAFDSATVDPNPANAPALEYPLDGTVVPGNLPAIEAQWSQAADNSVYRMRVRSAGVLDLAFYTSSRELEFAAPDWEAITAAAPDQNVELVVEGLGSGMLRASTPITIVPSADQIDESTIYVWLSSKGSFAVLDLINQVESALPTDSAALAPGQPCSGCHRVSRDGKRFSYSFNGANFQIGTLVYDEASKSFKSKIAPAAGVRGTYAAFNPLESTTRPAMLLSVPDDVEQNTAGNVSLELVNPDDNQPIASDIDQMTAALPSAIGQHTLMPDWSPEGDFVVFTAYPGSQHFVREVGDDVTLGSIVQASVSYDPAAQAFKFGAPEVLVQTPSTDPDSGENNLLPAISPDGAAVAFTRSDGWWSIKTQASLLNLSGRIALVRRSDGTVFELAGGTHGPAKDWSSTWPQWAPSIGSRYLWLAFATERPYGHRLTPASPENQSCTLVQGQKQCKHLWIMAIDKQALASGTVDPSRPPFWAPGQVLAQQYVSPFWTKSVPLVPR